MCVHMCEEISVQCLSECIFYIGVIIMRHALVHITFPSGIGEITQLFSWHDIADSLKDKYIQLLEKFEVALKISHKRVIVPSLMPNHASYPEIDYVKVDEYNRPALSRFWLSPYIPDGFWPRLICRTVNDHRIRKVLNSCTHILSLQDTSLLYKTICICIPIITNYMCIII